MRTYEELPLWEVPANRDENSRAAADAIEPTVPRLRRVVLDLITRWEPVATWELEELSGLAGNTVRPRVYELYNAGYIVRVGKNTTPSGRAAHTYAVNRDRIAS